MTINPSIVFRKEPDGTGLLFNADTGVTFYLNPTSRLICELAESGLDIDGIVHEMEARVNRMPQNARLLVEEFLEELLKKDVFLQ